MKAYQAKCKQQKKKPMTKKDYENQDWRYSLGPNFKRGAQMKKHNFEREAYQISFDPK